MSCATTTRTNHPLFHNGDRPLIIGHRGGSLEVPENTMSAFRHSLNLGLPWFELDVRMAADGPVVCHDDRTQRLAQGTNFDVWASSVQTLKTVDVGNPEPSAHAKSQLEKFGLAIPDFGDTFEGERIPTFAEALSLAEDIGIMVEMKQGPYGVVLADATIQAIHAANVSDRVVIGSFDTALLDRASELAPDIPLIGIVEEPSMLDEMLKRPLSLLAVPVGLVDVANRKRPQSVALWVWTIRHESEVRALENHQVDGLITDIPAKIREVFRQ